MLLREILQQLANDGNPVLFNGKSAGLEASVLLNTLSEIQLKKRSHLQPGMYIAEINDAGYLGTVLYRFK
jgi:hypothetical protein